MIIPLSETTKRLIALRHEIETIIEQPEQFRLSRLYQIIDEVRLCLKELTHELAGMFNSGDMLVDCEKILSALETCAVRFQQLPEDIQHQRVGLLDEVCWGCFGNEKYRRAAKEKPTTLDQQIFPDDYREYHPSYGQRLEDGFLMLH
jgi:hypothetical protein